MGWIVYEPDFETINLIGYLTSDLEFPAPQTTRHTLAFFFNALASGKTADHAFISSKPGWIKKIAHSAALAAEIMEKKTQTGERLPPPPGPTDLHPEGGWISAVPVSSDQVKEIVAPLRERFTGYSIYALMVPALNDRKEALEAFFQEFSHDSGDKGLAVMVQCEDSLVRVLDPFPALRALADMPVEPPAVVFWTALGATCALSLANAEDFFRHVIRGNLKKGKGVINQLVDARAREAGTKHLLHMSDLHFGDGTSNDSRRYIKSHLDRILSSVDRVVVTGDLFNSPDTEYRDQYLDFRADVERMTDKQLIVIPGNHDVRPKGNAIPGVLRPNYEFVFDIGWQPLVVDDDLKCVFFCFNSAEEGTLAKGCVTSSQRMRMASLFNEEVSRRLRRNSHNIDDYTKIALVHHHPFTYETVPTATFDKFIRTITRDEDSFTRLEKAEEFISWCAERGVSLILHGHKHVPHHVRIDVEIEGQTHTMVVIGCGSTTGAEGSPLCYDVVSLNPDTRRWGVTFHRDKSRSGAGFRIQSITIDARSAKSAW
jgi:Calcineurin-like phosphoesterase